jgi:hypothetical protein
MTDISRRDLLRHTGLVIAASDAREDSRRKLSPEVIHAVSSEPRKAASSNVIASYVKAQD